MGKKTEYRSIELRAAEDGKEMHVEGYAAVFGEKTLLWKSPYTGKKYFEIIEADAIDAQTNMGDVVLRYNHSDSAMILARTSNGTLRLNIDGKGIHVDADIINTNPGEDIYKLIKRGDINKMSFAFVVDQDSWETDEINKEETRRIKHINLIRDVSPVDFPAYDGTSISARSKNMIEELEKKERDEELRKKLIAQTYL